MYGMLNWTEDPGIVLSPSSWYDTRASLTVILNLPKLRATKPQSLVRPYGRSDGKTGESGELVSLKEPDPRRPHIRRRVNMPLILLPHP